MTSQPQPSSPFSWAGRNYRIQTAATVVSGLGNAAAPIATAYAVLATGGGTTEVGYVTAARMVPLVLLLLIGGALADRLPRHHVMVASNLFNALSQAALAALVLSGSVRLWELLLLSAAGGAGQAFYSPASEGMIMQSVAQEHAGKAFSIFRMAMNGAQIGGAALGGALVAAVGPGWVLAIDAVGFTVAAGLRIFLEVEAAPATGDGAGHSMVHELREGWREFVSRRWLWAVVLQFSVVMACITAVESVYGPVVAQQHLGGARDWGFAMAAFGIGMLACGVPMARWQPRRILLVGNYGVFLFALPALALALTAPLPVLATAMFVAGAGVTVFGVNWMVALQQEIPVELFSRVSAYDYFGSLALTPVGTALAGPASNALGLSGALWTCTALTGLLAAAVLAVPEVRRLSRARAPIVVTPAKVPVTTG
ncbi:MFS transporter [Kitasatospora atroaurantiaca]|uniref:Putative MFS family arabinose efflux permease n=1 Tax=Kitasatospora atroaurantiaca TaxID=285545 RepID=A0A561EK95_9ACTN|nr:MFS transporter [Kitasatospora atroaurantiaca]TWE15992.1 putative MFS family arabinose efflux permease [Kitasatospora atroaurantiaca]